MLKNNGKRIWHKKDNCERSYSRIYAWVRVNLSFGLVGLSDNISYHLLSRREQAAVVNMVRRPHDERSYPYKLLESEVVNPLENHEDSNLIAFKPDLQIMFLTAFQIRSYSKHQQLNAIIVTTRDSRNPK